MDRWCHNKACPMYAMKVVVGPASKVCSNYKGGCGIALKSFAVRGAPERSMLGGIASKVPHDSSNMMQNISTCETRQQEGMQPPSAAWPPSDRELLPAGKALIELQSLQAAKCAGCNLQESESRPSTRTNFLGQRADILHLVERFGGPARHGTRFFKTRGMLQAHPNVSCDWGTRTSFPKA